MTATEKVHLAQKIVDDAAAVAKALGFVCPPLVLPAAALQLAADSGFALFLSWAAEAAEKQAAAQTAGVAADKAQAVTSALEHEHEVMKRICPSCLDALASHLARTTP